MLAQPAKALIAGLQVRGKIGHRVQPDRGRIDTADHECHDQPVRHQPRRPHVLLPPGNAADVLAAGAQVRGRVVRRRVEIVLVDAGLEAIRLRS